MICAEYIIPPLSMIILQLFDTLVALFQTTNIVRSHRPGAALQLCFVAWGNANLHVNGLMDTMRL
jgi:hypothetical protein